MIRYLIKYWDKLLGAAWEHLLLVFTAMLLSLLLAAVLTLLCERFQSLGKVLLHLLSMLYSVPSLALLALMIPLTGLGKTTAVIVLVFYNQYLLLRNFLAGLGEVDKSVVEAATGMGMTPMQVLVRIKLPLSKRALAAGIRIALISTVSIATIAASVNAGGLGELLFDGLRTMNTAKIVWGSLLSALLAFLLDAGLGWAEKRVGF